MQAFTVPNSVDVSIRFEDGEGPALSVRALDAHFAMSALFDLKLLVSVAGDVALRTLIGRKVVVVLPDGVPLQGLLYRASHSERAGVANGVLLEIGPHLWSMTQKTDEYCWVDFDVAAIAKDICEDESYPVACAAELTITPEARPYTVQFDETEHDALFRLLAEDGLASFFDAKPEGTIFVFTNDTVSSSEKRQRRLAFAPPSKLAPSATPHVHRVDVTAQSVVDLAEQRDYWFERPDFEAVAAQQAEPSNAWSYFDRTRVGNGSTEAILARRTRDVLASFLVGQETIRLEANVPVLPGHRLTIDGATRPEANVPLLVVTTELRWSSQPGAAAVSQCVMVCTPASKRFVPMRRPKVKIGGLHTAKVQGEGEIDVDAEGRVLCEFCWENRPWTRRVRVSQGWAGPGYGFVTLPRVGDEVLIAYMDGDPDEPMVVGRVHNGKNLSPLTLPAQNTISTWRSRSSPGGEGYNEILMDDAAGAERLDIHAQRDSTQKIERDSNTWVGRDMTVEVKGDQKMKVKGTGDTQFSQPCRLKGPDCEIIATERFALKAPLVTIDANTRIDTTTGTYLHTANQALYNVAGGFIVTAGAITLSAGGSTIVLGPGGIEIKSSGPVNINGSPINLNC